MMIPVQSPTISVIVEMTIQNPMKIMFSDHCEKQWATSHQMILSLQHLQNEWRQQN